jgi:hypothetical protein
MNKITETITTAFLSGQPKSMGNTKTNGRSLWLFDNMIAEHREDGMYITNCGWTSRTTKERLNALPDVSIQQKKNKWYLNGVEWDGNWVKINSNQPPQVDESKTKNMFDLSKKWVSSDGWRGYEEPTYAVCGANDTGAWEDSPCPSDVAKKEIEDMVSVLKRDKIPTKILTTATSNVFCVHHYVVVPPYYIEKARELVADNYNKENTRLLYIN